MQPWRIAAVNFDHMHMGDNLRMAFDHPSAQIVGLCDELPRRMEQAAAEFQVPSDQLFNDYRACLERTRPDIVLLCPATAEHGMWVERIAPFGVHILIEKPFAASLQEADRMIRATQATGRLLAINWPLAWYPPHVTTKRIVDAGTIGEVLEVHYYDGNRGPLWHVSDKAATDAETVAREKPDSWFYQRARGGGSLFDYLGYGATLGTWLQGGRTPVEVTAVVDDPPGLEVDEHSITIARYAHGLSKFETRWGTFTDPWTHQPQPRCGFVVVGTAGTISSYDYQPLITIQTRRHPQERQQPVDTPKRPMQDPVQYLIHCLETEQPLAGPLAPEISRIGQQIVDAAVRSAAVKRTVPLEGATD